MTTLHNIFLYCESRHDDWEAISDVLSNLTGIQVSIFAETKTKSVEYCKEICQTLEIPIQPQDQFRLEQKIEHMDMVVAFCMPFDDVKESIKRVIDITNQHHIPMRIIRRKDLCPTSELILSTVCLQCKNLFPWICDVDEDRSEETDIVIPSTKRMLEKEYPTNLCSITCRLAFAARMKNLSSDDYEKWLQNEEEILRKRFDIYIKTRKNDKTKRNITELNYDETDYKRLIKKGYGPIKVLSSKYNANTKQGWTNIPEILRYRDASVAPVLECQAILKNGNQCRRRVVPGTRYCRHQAHIQQGVTNHNLRYCDTTDVEERNISPEPPGSIATSSSSTRSASPAPSVTSTTSSQRKKKTVRDRLRQKMRIRTSKKTIEDL